MEEIWKDIEGYEGLYKISNYGNIINLHSRWGKRKKPRKLTLSINKDYIRCGLSKDGKETKFYVHRLVAKNFIPNPNNYPCINHKDENKLNNNANNLEWCDYSYNNNYGSRNDKVAKKLKNGIYCKKIMQYDLSGNLIKEWVSINEASRKLNIKPSCICLCCRNKQKTASGYIWRYKKEA